VNQQPLITTTEAVDTAFYVIFGISGIALLGITVAMVYLSWRYSRKKYPTPLSQKDHNVWLEITWTIIPTILVMIMFWYGWEGYLSLRKVPDGAIPIDGNARMWSWLFTYENGKTSDKLYVPVGKPVVVKLNSEDVLHAFYVPAFRVKRDTVPGMETYAWFVAEEPGSYDLFCAEYCGVAHADMITTVEAVPPAEFAGWLAAEPLVANAGEAVLQQHGCLGCHSLDGSPSVGPTFQGIGGRDVAVVINGELKTIKSDRAYLERAIVDPEVEIVDGFPPAMPSYADKISAEEMASLLDYLEGLSGDVAPEAKAEEPAPGEETDATQEMKHAEEKPADSAAAAAAAPADPVTQGQALASQNGCLGCHSTDGTRRVGPSLKGLMDSERTVTKDGATTTLKADTEYLIRAIREPGVEVTEGYPAVMPPSPGMSDDDIKAIEAWMRSLE
jgi:cytochrome c oxidase subunit 2